MVKTTDDKILRVGVIRRGKIVEERLLRKKQDVTIGSQSKNTFAISGSDLPKTFRLFSISRNGSYNLEFSEDMEGRVFLGDKVQKLSEVREKDETVRKGSRSVVSLTSQSRGKVIVGDVTFLFQFVAPPGQVSRPQLPVTVKKGFLGNFDLILTALLLLSFILQGGFAGGLHFWWEKTGKYEQVEKRSSDRLLAALVVEVEEQEEQRLQDEKEEEEKEDEEKEDEPAEKPEPAPKPEPPPKPEKKKVIAKVQKPEKVVKPKKASFERKREKVIDATILKFVTSQGEDGDSGLSDALKDGATAKSLDDAWDTTGVRVADAGEDAMFRGGPKKDESGGNTYRKLDKKDVKGPKAGSVKTKGKKEKAVKGSVGMRKGSVIGGSGKMDKGSVASVIKKRKSAIRKCYESALRTNSKVAGKVIVQFTVGPRGRVTKSSVSSNSTGDDGVGKCIAKRLKGWRFPKPENGSVTFSYPFVLSKAN